jgi:hypothetical protein
MSGLSKFIVALVAVLFIGIPIAMLFGLGTGKFVWPWSHGWALCCCVTPWVLGWAYYLFIVVPEHERDSQKR